jgi:selenocysteine-specific elongation factor
LIVGTAGHIDHGKTTLVRALTGVDTDRLPEERQRGISIELGYAFLDAPATISGQPAARIGFIDVPGHERLVHTMVAGATGIDYAMLLVAADDGVMPQTREHLAVLSLLGLRRGVVALTKCDRVDATRLQAVSEEVMQLLQPTTLAGAAVLPVSAVSGVGVAALQQHLLQAASDVAAHPKRNRAFRLAIDRAFTLDGVGTVVTGTVHAGLVTLSDELSLVPGDRVLRVRSLHAQNCVVTQASAGQRCAVALAGIDKQDIERGQWLVAPQAVGATARLDVLLTLWHGEARPLRSGTTVFVHIGAAATQASVALLDPSALEPGQSGRVQLVLRRPLGAWYGDRVLLRDASASRTLAGGQVLDPSAPARYRRTSQRLAELDALSLPNADERLRALLAVVPNGVDLQRYAAAQGQAIGVLPADALRYQDAHLNLALGATQNAHARRRALELLATFHASHPEEFGPDTARLRRLALPRLHDALWRALLAGLQAEGLLKVRGAFVHLPEHGVRLSASEERLAQKFGPRLLEAGFEGAWVRDLARGSAEPEALVRGTLARLARRGEIFQVVKDLYYPAHTMATLGTIARQVAAGNEGDVTAAAFRDATGLGRKRAIQVLEHLDRIGLLHRVGDLHRLRADCLLFTAEHA